MLNCSPAMSMRRDKQRPGLEMRSPLATATCSLAPPEKMTPVRYVALVLMKLWVEPESRRARSEVESMARETCMVRQVLGWMPVSVANEMVGPPSSSSSSSSMENRRLHASVMAKNEFLIALEAEAFQPAISNFRRGELLDRRLVDRGCRR
jgi:hypothetical protein